MWLVIGSPDDQSAHWVYNGLKAAGLDPIQWLSVDVLSCSLMWEHRVSSNNPSITIELYDGEKIEGSEVRGVVNRITSLQIPQLEIVSESDRDYALHEFNAFFLSWLYSLDAPVLNRPSSGNLSGPWMHRSEWLLLAAQSGLPTQPCNVSSYDNSRYATEDSQLSTYSSQVFVVGRQVVGDNIPESIAQGCRRLAELSNTSLLGITFALDFQEPWTCIGATPLPDVQMGGQNLLTALKLQLEIT